LIESVLETSQNPDLWYERPRVTHEALEKLSEKIDREMGVRAVQLEEESLSAKIVVMALNWSKCRILGEEIDKYYGQLRIPPERFGEPERRQPLKQVDTSPQLLCKHVTEEYRLGWELYMLMSRVRFEPKFLRDNSYEAIARIGNKKSVVVLDYRLKKLCSDPEAETMGLVMALVRIPSRRSLDVLIESAQLWKELRPKRLAILNPPIKPGEVGPLERPEPDEDVRRNVVEAFTQLSTTFPEKVAPWKEIIASMPRDELKQEAKQLVLEIEDRLGR
jgi:hypothetical protein